MRIVAQKVHRASLSVDNTEICSIQEGLLLFVGVLKEDSIEDVQYLAKKITRMRMWKGQDDKLDYSLLDIDGEVMVVSNFTLGAHIKSGTRPDFGYNAEKPVADALYLQLAQALQQQGVKKVVTGQFAHHMHIDTLLDGPFTIIVDHGKTVVPVK